MAQNWNPRTLRNTALMASALKVIGMLPRLNRHRSEYKRNVILWVLRGLIYEAATFNRRGDCGNAFWPREWIQTIKDVSRLSALDHAKEQGHHHFITLTGKFLNKFMDLQGRLFDIDNLPELSRTGFWISQIDQLYKLAP